MTCSYCGGNVLWMGPLSNLTHTECQNCGAKNSQLQAWEYYYDGSEDEETNPEVADGAE